ncbi:MAG: hypothetical protein ACOC5T_01715 [Elusimicrobiota bacterium]
MNKFKELKERYGKKLKIIKPNMKHPKTKKEFRQEVENKFRVLER